MSKATQYPPFDATGTPNDLVCDVCGLAVTGVRSYLVDDEEWCEACFVAKYRVKAPAPAPAGNEHTACVFGDGGGFPFG